ncbi:MAG TPA: glycosyltransferase family 4 protein [Planctomycetaceae bacterium]
MKILFLQKRPLFPTNDGGKVRTLNVVRHLARWHELVYLCNSLPGDGGNLDAMRRLGLRLEAIPWREAPRGSVGFYRDLAWNLLSPYPFNVAKDYDPRLRSRAAELLAAEAFDLIVCDFVQMARNAIGLPGPPRVLFEHNVEAEIFKRHAEAGGSWPRRRYMRHQWHKMRRFEAEAGRQFDAVVAVSERDRRIFEEEYGWRHVRTIDTAVDTEFYRPAAEPEREGRVVFVGSLDWLPNVDGTEFFVRQVWPLIRRARPDATLQIVGRNPLPAVRRLADEPAVEVVPDVPDTRPHLAEAAVVVVPLLTGGGTRLKIFEAMAMGKSIVSTSLGAEGLVFESGRHLELADDPESFASRTVELLSDADRRRRMGEAARDHVVRNFSAEAVARQFERICIDTAGAGAETDRSRQALARG